MRIKGTKKKRTKALLCAFAWLVCLAGCMPSSATTSAMLGQAEIITQKPLMEGRVPITVLVKYAFSINLFETAVEEKFPQVDIIQVGNFTRDMGVAEYAARLEHGDLTDIVMTWPLDVGEAYWPDRLMDLSGMEFTNRYNLSMLNTIAKEGALYYLPGPAQVRGIVYNQTLFAEKGWQVPKDYAGFLALCKTIEASGIRSLQLGFKNAEVLDTALYAYNYSSSFSSMQHLQWLDDYNKGEGSLGDNFAPALEVFQQMIDEGIWQEGDLDIDYAERETMLFSRQCAMVEDSVLMARMGHRLTGTKDKFALMPFFSPGDESDWARLYMVCYIGLNKALEEPENKDKYDVIMEIMEYISTTEGQEALAADTGAMLSSLTGAAPPNVPEIEAIKPALEQGRYAVFPQLENAQEALRQGLAGMLRGVATKQEVIRMADEQNKHPPKVQPPKVLATATRDFTMLDTGNFVTDVMRQQAGTEIALFMDNGKDGRYNGKGISGRLYANNVTETDVLRILPDIKHGEAGVLCTAEMTGENLLQTLEYAIPVDNEQVGWFYYFSGLKMEYSVENAPGQRIGSITLADGSKLEMDRVYTLAYMDETLPEELVLNGKATTQTIVQVVEDALKAAGTISPAEDGRFRPK